MASRSCASTAEPCRLEGGQFVAGLLALLAGRLRLTGVAGAQGIADLPGKPLDPGPQILGLAGQPAVLRCPRRRPVRTSSAGTPLRARAALVASRSVRRRRRSIIGPKLTGGTDAAGTVRGC